MRNFGVLAVLAFGLIGCDQYVDNELSNISAKVAEDAEAQYSMVAGAGSAIDKCVQAGMVVAAHLQAQNTAEYQRWQIIKRADCMAAGLPE